MDHRGTEQTFRYAPLSSGFDMVRNSGAHEIATVQTTAIDQAAGLINLTTVLAHASGKGSLRTGGLCRCRHGHPPGWARLAYARRYVLFTLVGIAGEEISMPRPHDAAAAIVRTR